MKNSLASECLSTLPRYLSIRETEALISSTDLELLKRLVETDSTTDDVNGVNAVQSLLAKQLQNMGFQVRFIDNPEAGIASGCLLVAELPGVSAGYVNLVGHADTVLSNNFHGGMMRVEGNRAYGSGVIDDKGGLIVALSGLRKTIQILQNSRTFGLRFICSPNEEKGSPGFHSVFADLALDANIILGFEPAAGEGDVVISRKGNRWYDIHVYGQKAHAGRDFDKGVNACQALAVKLTQSQGLTQLGKGVSINIGKISGGVTHNVVSDYAYGQLDVRYPCFETCTEVNTKIENILGCTEGSPEYFPERPEIRYKIVDDCPPLPASEGAEQLFMNYRHLVEQVEGRSVDPVKVGGASDCNHFSSPGKIILDGLGPVGGGMHTEEEYVELNSIETRSQSLAHLLASINRV